MNTHSDSLENEQNEQAGKARGMWPAPAAADPADPPVNRQEASRSDSLRRRSARAAAVAAAMMGLFAVYPVSGKSAEPAAAPAFAKANALYEAGNFSEAAAAYQREIHAGRYRANVFFNLGDTYYRLGDLGRAIINYQRALLLEPGHAEAAANLAFVRGKTSVRFPPPEGSVAQLRATLDTVDVDAYVIAAAVSGWVAAAGLCLGIFPRRRRSGGWIVVGLALPVFAACVGTLYWLGDGRKDTGRAIVLKDQTAAHYAPADSSKIITKLPVGDEVRVLSEHGAWIYTQLGGGARAWLLADTVERIIPPAFLPPASGGT